MISAFMNDGALFARSKAMYGKLLSSAELEALSARGSMRAFVAALKELPAYCRVFDGVNENMMHYGQIEQLLRRRLFEQYVRLHSLVGGSEKPVMECVMLRAEMLEILDFLMMLEGSREHNYFMPSHLARQTHVDYDKFSACNSFVEFLQLIRHTDYYELLAGFASSAPLDYTRIETALINYFFKKYLRSVMGISDAGVRKQTERYVREEIDIRNISRMWRMRKYFDYPIREVSGLLIRIAGKRDSAFTVSLLQAQDLDTFIEILHKSKYAFVADQLGDRYSDRVYNVFLHKTANHLMHSPTPSVLHPIVYIGLLELEIHNLLTVVEGLRYELTPQQIRNYLVI